MACWEDEEDTAQLDLTLIHGDGHIQNALVWACKMLAFLLCILALTILSSLGCSIISLAKSAHSRTPLLCHIATVLQLSDFVATGGNLFAPQFQKALLIVGKVEHNPSSYGFEINDDT